MERHSHQTHFFDCKLTFAQALTMGIHRHSLAGRNNLASFLQATLEVSETTMWYHIGLEMHTYKRGCKGHK